MPVAICLPYVFIVTMNGETNTTFSPASFMNLGRHLAMAASPTKRSIAVFKTTKTMVRPAPVERGVRTGSAVQFPAAKRRIDTPERIGVQLYNLVWKIWSKRFAVILLK